MYHNLFDSHTHSDNSHDGHDSISMMCESVSTNNLIGFCVTDHYECNMPENHSDTRLRDSIFEIRKAQAAFKNQIIITCGIELGQATHALDVAEGVLSNFTFDFVLGSLHNIRSTPDFCKLDFHTLDIGKILTQYYEEMLELAHWGKFDSLSHMTYPLRYIEGIQKIPVDMKPYEELIREILKTVASQGKAIEINTSTIRQGLGATMPPLSYVKLFRELGGEYVTIGSDAHWAKDIGSNISDGMQLLKEAGYDYFTIFVKRQPTPLKII